MGFKINKGSDFFNILNRSNEERLDDVIQGKSTELVLITPTQEELESAFAAESLTLLEINWKQSSR